MTNGKSLHKLFTKAKQGLQGHLMFMRAKEGQPADIPKVRSLLQRHQDVFSKPKGLPPIRSRDHKIPLKEESQPINLRPYRVPYIQKVEIEKQIKKMLLNGIIQPSSSPYAVPVILVHKKDES